MTAFTLPNPEPIIVERDGVKHFTFELWRPVFDPRAALSEKQALLLLASGSVKEME